jgi:DNA-binding IclR family transcriptional regulator
MPATNARSVEQAIDLLLTFIETPCADASQLKAKLNISRPTLYRLLKTLENKGLLRSMGQPREYELTPLVIELANSWLSLVDPARIGVSYLRELFRKTNETTSLYVMRDGDKRVCVLQFQAKSLLSCGPELGYTGPLYSGTTGKTMLAFLPKAEIDAILQSAPNTIVRNRIRKTLTAIRQKSFHLAQGELVEGASSVAAPVFGTGGRVVAAVVVSVPDVRLTNERRDRFVAEVLATAQALSSALGAHVSSLGAA